MSPHNKLLGAVVLVLIFLIGIYCAVIFFKGSESTGSNSGQNQNHKTPADDDGVGDNADKFPEDPNETKDSDGDGVGDNLDEFPDDPNETKDSDGDGVGDNLDEFPDDPNETKDSDGDGVGDNADAFPDNPTEQVDTDGDGVGDNADKFKDDPAESVDTDDDGVGDNADKFPEDPNETKDSDGDGVGDNLDEFPDDPNETKDSDGDGVGDNLDEFPDDPNETKDSDGDGVGDNADAFPDNPTEQVDTDGDGVGDNADADYPLVDKLLTFEALAVLSSMIAFLSICIAFYLYRWRAIMLADGTSAVVPEALGVALKSLKKAIESSQKHLGESVERQASFVQGQAKTIKTFSADVGRQGNQVAQLIGDLMEGITSMRSMLAEKDAEIKRLKTGHDQAVYKRFVMRFVRLEARMNKLLTNEDVSQKDLKNLKILLEDAIEQSGVEPFSPDIGVDYEVEVGVEDGPVMLETNDPAKDMTIAEVLSPGYEVSGTEERNIIIPAKVAVYTFVEKLKVKKED